MGVLKMVYLPVFILTFWLHLLVYSHIVLFLSFLKIVFLSVIIFTLYFYMTLLFGALKMIYLHILICENLTKDNSDLY